MINYGINLFANRKLLQIANYAIISTIALNCSLALRNKGDEDKTQSPFYLGSEDYPGNIITNVVLKGDKFNAWSRAIKLALKPRGKFRFVDGSIMKPTDSRKHLDWETVNSMIVSRLTRTMDPRAAASVPYHKEARTL